ncbi:MAG: serine/threonine-protein kinase [Kofleriaceae bacterium]|nr:serine/threonine-protein kinase [Kofleriaceae bacterium]
MAKRSDEESADRTLVDVQRTQLGVGHRAEFTKLKAKREDNLPAQLVGKTVLGRYRLEALLGKGAMGAVFRGVDEKLDREVAVKVMHQHLGAEPTMLARFQREAKAAGRLQHPNLVSVLDVGTTPDGLQVMVLELARGPALVDLLTAPLPRARIVLLVRQLLSGLAHAHDAGLIHRDLKPGNVLVERAPDGSELARIVDFGIAALRDPDDSVAGGKLTSTGQVLGTPVYMAPEQATGEAIDHRIDLFALGVIVYEMLSGQWPFDGNAIEIALANISKDPPPVEQRTPGANPDPMLERFARKLMARQLDRRFASAHEALEVLDQIDTDPQAAALALGVTDIHKSLGTITLPPIK